MIPLPNPFPPQTSPYRALLVLLLVIVALAAWGRANAATVRLNCNLPSQYTNGDPIGTAPISLKAYWGTSATALTTVVPLASCAGGQVTVPDPAAGATVTYIFAVTATVNGMESAKSNTASKAIATPLPTPNPPTGLTAAAGAIAWSIKPDYTTFGPMKLSATVGTVRARTACVTRQNIAGTNYYRVPKSAVAFSGAATDYVVAKCEGV